MTAGGRLRSSRAATLTFLSLALLLPLLPFSPTATAQVETGLRSFTEDFEDDTFPNPPSEDWYRAYPADNPSTADPTLDVDETGGNPGRAAKCSTTAASAAGYGCYFDLGGVNVDFCNGGSVRFDFKITSLSAPTTGPGPLIQLVGTGFHGGLFMPLNSGAPTPSGMRARSYGGNSVALDATFPAPAPTFGLNTWYTVTIDGQDCVGAKIRVSLNGTSAVSDHSTSWTAGASRLDSLHFTYETASSLNVGTYVALIDNLQVTGVNARGGVFTESSPRTLTSAPTRTSDSRIAKLSESTFLQTQYDSSGADLKVAKCSYTSATKTASCNSLVTAATAGTIGSTSDIRPIDASTAVLCTTDLTDLFFLKTTNGGTSYSGLTTVVATTDSIGAGCRIQVIDADSYVIAYYRTSGTLALFTTRSDDAGATWSTPNQVTTISSGCTAWDSIGFAASGAKWAILLSCEGSGFGRLRSCYTSNSGTAWSCPATDWQSSINVDQIDLITRPDGSFLGCSFDDTGTNAPAVIYGTAAGDSWQVNRLNLLGAASNGYGCSIVQTDQDSYGLTYVGVQPSGSAACRRAYWTNDDGGNWAQSAIGLAQPLGQELGSSACYTNAAAMFGGVMLTAFGTTATGATNPLIMYAASSVTEDGIAASASVSVDSLVGFDVNPLGGVVVARVQGVTSDDRVVTFDAGTLVQSAAGFETDCNRLDGVMAAYQGTLVAFLDCNTGDPTDLVIRTSAMTQPNWGTCDECTDVVSLSGFSKTGGDEASEIGQLKDYPVDQTNNHPALGLGRRQVAWGFSGLGTTNIGTIGVNTWTNAKIDTDTRFTEEVQWSNTQNPKDFCVGLDPQTDYYLAAVGDTSPTKFYRVDLYTDALASTANALKATISQSPTVLSSAFGQATGVACGQRTVLVRTPTDVGLFQTNGALVWSKPSIDASPRGAAVSELFNENTGDPCTYGTTGCRQFAAYKEGSKVIVVDAKNGTFLTSLDVPSGDWRGMSIDRTAQNVWMFTSEFIQRFQILQKTTKDPLSPQGGVNFDEVSDLVPSTVPTGLAGRGAQIGEALEIGDFGGNLLGAFLLMFIAGAGVAQETGQKMGWVIGAAAGLVLAWAFSFVDDGAIFVIVLIVGGAGWLVFRARSRGA